MESRSTGFHNSLAKPMSIIGGGAAEYLKKAVKKALESLGLPIKIKIAAASDNPKFQGYSSDNIVNRLAVQGIHIEQFREAREHSKDIAKAVASVCPFGGGSSRCPRLVNM